MSKYNIQTEAVIKAIKSAKDYEKVLRNNRYLLICRNNAKNIIECLEIRFPEYAYQHLTGLELSQTTTLKSSTDFYNACLQNKLSEKDVVIEDTLMVEVKLSILPQLINFVHYSRMTVVFNGGRPYLKCDKVVGTTNFSMAIKKSETFYIPVSCLREDIRNFGDEVYQVIAVFSANYTDDVFSKIKNVAKGVNLRNINIPEKYKNVIDLSNYKEPDSKKGKE